MTARSEQARLVIVQGQEPGPGKVDSSVVTVGQFTRDTIIFGEPEVGEDYGLGRELGRLAWGSHSVETALRTYHALSAPRVVTHSRFPWLIWSVRKALFPQAPTYHLWDPQEVFSPDMLDITAVPAHEAAALIGGIISRDFPRLARSPRRSHAFGETISMTLEGLVRMANVRDPRWVDLAFGLCDDSKINPNVSTGYNERMPYRMAEVIDLISDQPDLKPELAERAVGWVRELTRGNGLEIFRLRFLERLYDKSGVGGDDILQVARQFVSLDPLDQQQRHTGRAYTEVAYERILEELRLSLYRMAIGNEGNLEAIRLLTRLEDYETTPASDFPESLPIHETAMLQLYKNLKTSSFEADIAALDELTEYIRSYIADRQVSELSWQSDINFAAWFYSETRDTADITALVYVLVAIPGLEEFVHVSTNLKEKLPEAMAEVGELLNSTEVASEAEATKMTALASAVIGFAQSFLVPMAEGLISGTRSEGDLGIGLFDGFEWLISIYKNLLRWLPVDAERERHNLDMALRTWTDGLENRVMGLRSMLMQARREGGDTSLGFAVR